MWSIIFGKDDSQRDGPLAEDAWSAVMHPITEGEGQLLFIFSLIKARAVLMPHGRKNSSGPPAPTIKNSLSPPPQRI
jgi:hypothetical protein